MKSLVESFPQQLQAALEIGKKANYAPSGRDIRNVVISGLGGSGIGGKIVSQLIIDHCGVPLTCINDYLLPAFVNENTLVIISSYSGDTEETVSSLRDALEKKAVVACITSGGEIRNIAAREKINTIEIPAGNPPRSMLAYSLVQILFVLLKEKLTDDGFINDIQTSISKLRESQKEIAHEALKIADRITNRIPVIYGGSAYEGVLIRWRQQLNENSKELCWHHVLPEMTHNELVGWTGGDNRFAVIMIRNSDDHPRNSARMEICRNLISKNCDTIIEIWGKGESRIEKVLYLVHLGDLLSVRIAEIKSVDAMEIPAINFLKSELAKVK